MPTYLYVGSVTEQQDIVSQQQALMNKYPFDIVVREPNADPGYRPKLTRLIKRLKRHDRLIVSDVSKLGRSLQIVANVAAQLSQRGVFLEVDNLNVTSASNLNIFALIANAAQMDADLLHVRRSIGIARAKRAGKYKGRKATSAAIIAQANALIAQGVKKNQVAKQLNIGESTLYKYLAANK